MADGCNAPSSTTASRPQVNWGPIVSAAISIIGFAAIWGSNQAKIETLQTRNAELSQAIAETNRKLEDALTRQWDIRSSVSDLNWKITALDSSIKALQHGGPQVK